MARSFAYNPSHIVIAGKTLTGDISVGEVLQATPSSLSGLAWWNGPDETTGYVIGSKVPAGNHPTPLGNIGTVQFWRSSALTDVSFIALVNQIFAQSFATAATAKSYLTAAGHWTSWTPPTYTVGQSALGGKVFYVYNGGQNGYVAKTSDLSSVEWGCKGVDVGASSVVLGGGMQNTIDIVNGCATAGTAARNSYDLVTGGYDDWYLPNRGEAYQMWVNRSVLSGLNPFNPYWTSNQASSNNAFMCNIGGASANDGTVGAKSSVVYNRPIRGF